MGWSPPKQWGLRSRKAGMLSLTDIKANAPVPLGWERRPVSGTTWPAPWRRPLLLVSKPLLGSRNYLASKFKWSLSDTDFWDFWILKYKQPPKRKNSFRGMRDVGPDTEKLEEVSAFQQKVQQWCCSMANVGIHSGHFARRLQNGGQLPRCAKLCPEPSCRGWATRRGSTKAGPSRKQRGSQKRKLFHGGCYVAWRAWGGQQSEVGCGGS